LDRPPIAIYEDLSDFYEELHQGREKEFQFYGDLMPRPGALVLDVACGTGEIGGRLAERGADVTGLDASAAMLARARKRCGSARWLLGDMRAIRLQERFDLAICALNSMQHLETEADLARTLGCIRDHLAPGGLFAFDVFNPAEMFLAGPRHNVLMRRFHSAFAGRELSLYEDTNYDADRLLLHVNWRLVDSGSGARIAESRSTMRQIFPAALDAMLAAAGFAVTEKYGDFERTPFQPTHARQVVMARKA
jgi:SAM-dependent methyltransferase